MEMLAVKLRTVLAEGGVEARSLTPTDIRWGCCKGGGAQRNVSCTLPIAASIMHPAQLVLLYLAPPDVRSVLRG